jgi:undecaprenyl-diphosphatase
MWRALGITIWMMTNHHPPHSESNQSTRDSSGSDNIVSPLRVAKRARCPAVAYVGITGVYTVLAIFAHHYAYFEWDLSLARGIQSISLPGFGILMVAVSFLGSWFAWPLVLTTGLILMKKRLRAEAAVCVAGTAMGDLINLLFKFLIGRPRPTDVLVNVTRVYQQESFPSGHVVFFVEFFGFLFFLAYVLLRSGWVRRGSQVVLGVLVALAGVSRVYLGAHWPSDVLGAYLAGGIWLMLMIDVYRRIKARRQN